jgi:tetratricopeptide (TPR) repeat protein
MRCSSRNRVQEAIGDLTSALRGKPDDARLRASRGRAYQRLKRYELAIADLETALARDPDQPIARDSLMACCNNRALELAKGPESTRDPQRVLFQARRAIELLPDESLPLNSLGVAQYRAGRYAQAITILEQSLAAGAGQSDACDLFFLAMAHHRLGHREEARRCLDRATAWLARPPALTPAQLNELASYRTEAEAVLAGPAGELPVDVFAP